MSSCTVVRTEGGRVKLFKRRKVILSLVGNGNWSRCKKSQIKKRIQSAQLFHSSLGLVRKR